jgi:hypothetical protein
MAACPGSHHKVQEINSYRRNHQEDMKDESDSARFLKPFTSCGLTAGPVNAAMGLNDIFLQAALFHNGLSLFRVIRYYLVKWPHDNVRIIMWSRATCREKTLWPIAR